MHGTRISFHLGALCTDDDLLIGSLRRNNKALHEHAVVVPKPGNYRPLIREVLERLNGAPANQDTQDVLFEHITKSEDAERIVLSAPFSLANHPGAFTDGQLYPQAGARSAALRNLFPDNPVELFFAVRDPATWIPEMHSYLPDTPFVNYVDGLDPEHLLWSDVIRDIREANPETPITVWCNEDTPMIWPEVMHEVVGLDSQIPLSGGFRILSKIMAKEGIKRLRSYLASHPPINEIQRRRIISAFLDKYALDEEVEEEIDLPGWTPELIEQLSNIYDEDMLEVSRVPGVTVLSL